LIIRGLANEPRAPGYSMLSLGPDEADLVCELVAASGNARTMTAADLEEQDRCGTE
jgi:hypothetical protein